MHHQKSRGKPMITQIFATFGPACGTKEIIEEMILAGMTGMRLNLSHTTLQASESYINAYQEAAKELGVRPQILIDMQGPELRIGRLQEPVLWEQENIVLLGEKGIPVPKEVIAEAECGDRILLDDGRIQIEAFEILVDSIQAKVLRGGLLQGHKSIKIQGKNVKMPVLTEHDLENIRLAKEYGVTALMQPFVLSAEDLVYVRNALKENHAEDIKIFAKIENRGGVERLENILTEADVVVIARGDLANTAGAAEK